MQEAMKVIQFLPGAPNLEQIGDQQWMFQEIDKLVIEVGTGVTTQGNVVNLIGPQAGMIEAGLDRQAGKPRVILDPIQAFLGDRKLEAAIDHQSCSRARMKGVDSQYVAHQTESFDRFLFMGAAIIPAEMRAFQAKSCCNLSSSNGPRVTGKGSSIIQCFRVLQYI